MSDLLEVSENSYFRWKAKDHPALISLIEKHFNDEEIVEFLNNGKIEQKNISINKSLFKKVEEKANEYGLSAKSYVEHLIINDIQSNKKVSK